MFLGFLNPLRLTKAFRLRAARKRYRKRPGPKEAMALGRLLADLGDRTGALEVLGKARASFPRVPDLKKLHDAVWARAAQVEIAALERSSRSGGRVEDHARLIELHRSLGSFDRSLAVAAEAEKKYPKSWLLRLAVGKTLYSRFLAKRSREDGAKAVECLRETVRLRPDCARALLYLAALLAELGQVPEALSAVEDLLKVAPGNERALRLKERLSRIASKGGPRKGAGARPRIAADPEIMAGLFDKLRSNPAVYGAFLFGPDGNILHRHAVDNEHFVVEGHESAVAALGKAAQLAAERMGIGRLNTCVIEGNPWRIHFGEIAGGMAAVLAGRSFEPGEFENTVSRFSMEVVNR